MTRIHHTTYTLYLNYTSECPIPEEDRLEEYAGNITVRLPDDATKEEQIRLKDQAAEKDFEQETGIKLDNPGISDYSIRFYKNVEVVYGAVLRGGETFTAQVPDTTSEHDLHHDLSIQILLEQLAKEDFKEHILIPSDMYIEINIESVTFENDIVERPVQEKPQKEDVSLGKSYTCVFKLLGNISFNETEGEDIAYGWVETALEDLKLNLSEQLQKQVNCFKISDVELYPEEEEEEEE